MLPESFVVAARVATVVGLLPEACVLVRVGRSGRPRLRLRVNILEIFWTCFVNILDMFCKYFGNILEISWKYFEPDMSSLTLWC